MEEHEGAEKSEAKSDEAVTGSSTYDLVYAAAEGCRRRLSGKVTWADCASDEEGCRKITPSNRAKENLRKQPLSSLSACVAGRARAVLRPGNEMGRWSAGISRSEMSDADSAAAPAQVIRSSQSLSVGSASLIYVLDRFAPG